MIQVLGKAQQQRSQEKQEDFFMSFEKILCDLDGAGANEIE